MRIASKEKPRTAEDVVGWLEVPVGWVYASVGGGGGPQGLRLGNRIAAFARALVVGRSRKPA